MDKSAYEVRVGQWASIIKNQASSNMSKSAWCRENGINVRQFFYWQRRLRNMILQSSDLLPSTTTFCELSVPEEAVPISGQSNDSGIIIEINGCRVIVGDTVSARSLASVIEVLRHV